MLLFVWIADKQLNKMQEMDLSKKKCQKHSFSKHIFIYHELHSQKFRKIHIRSSYFKLAKYGKKKQLIFKYKMKA